ncbi:MAG: flagellar biosynthesis protein FlhF [Proteobacteria bacterium]|nr:flagellar biosynthesis protein FlhF [Pseudomonadota bacterium]
MKIKRVVAESMREALDQVRSEQGADAVIISNRRVDGGIELITAVDYDETLIEEALRRVRPAAEKAERAARPEVVAPAAAAAIPVPPAAPAPRPAPAAPLRVVSEADPALVAMRREVESLRGLLQEQLASLAWSDRLRREPLKALVLRDLSALGVAPDIARLLAARLPARARGDAPERLAAALLLKNLPAVEHGVLGGGVHAVVGPTGVGKTTTIAKLAARWALKHGANDLALVSLDHYRIGARDQLLTFARILGVPMHVAASARELGTVLQALSARRLVLIDTAGMSPHDPRLAEQFATLNVPGRQVRTLLALPATGEPQALEEIVRSYARVRPDGLVLTKLDEAASLGGALSVALRHALPLAWLADGQRIPDDLHAAPAKRVWLVKKAIKLAARRRDTHGVDDAYLAAHFGKVAING